MFEEEKDRAVADLKASEDYEAFRQKVGGEASSVEWACLCVCVCVCGLDWSLQVRDMNVELTGPSAESAAGHLRGTQAAPGGARVQAGGLPAKGTRTHTTLPWPLIRQKKQQSHPRHRVDRPLTVDRCAASAGHAQDGRRGADHPKVPMTEGLRAWGDGVWAGPGLRAVAQQRRMRGL
jgi:hypothetical protein